MTVTIKRLLKLGSVLMFFGLGGLIGCGEETPDEHAGHDHDAGVGQTERQIKIPDAVIQGLAELGVLGMTVSKEYGRLGMMLGES